MPRALFLVYTEFVTSKYLNLIVAALLLLYVHTVSKLWKIQVNSNSSRKNVNMESRQKY